MHRSVLLAFTAYLECAYSCSTTVVGRSASATGSVIASHSNDGDGGGFYHSSLNRVLAAEWAPNATRNVKGHEIPQISHTYAYHTEGYAAMNEHQVGLAESTCAGRSFPPTGAPRAGFFDIVQLGQVALERANSSRRAVRVMGELAETWGYADNAESLIVIDPQEAFIFQIMPDDTGNSSLWVAQRVPDDHVGAVTNGLTVRVIDFSDKTNFMSSGGFCKGGTCALQATAKRHHLWKTGEPFDFAKLFGKGGVGEPSAGPQLYVSRRMWSAYRRFGGPDLPSNITDFIMDG
jgi:dipeptidase